MTGLRWKWILALAALVVLAPVGAVRADAPASGAEDLLAQASAAYDAGIAKLGSDRGAATARFQEAAACYRALIEQHGLASGALQYNLGNAYFLAGDTGRAVLCYERARRQMPFDGSLQANLAAARAKLPSGSPAPPTERWWDAALAYARFVPARARLWAFIAGFALAWAAAIGRVLALPWWPGRCASVVPAVVSALALVTLAGEAAADRTERRGVIVTPELQTRTGPDEVVHPAGSPATLAGGVEFTLVRQQNGAGDAPAWSQIRLGDGREVWVRTDGIEMIARE